MNLQKNFTNLLRKHKQDLGVPDQFGETFSYK